jgi:glycosyltransferase involved in cell wall biosynthesis
MLALSAAGGVRLAMLVASELASRGNDVRVIAPSYASQPPVEFAEGVSLEVIESPGSSRLTYMRRLAGVLRPLEGVVVSTGYLTPALILASGTNAQLFGMVQGDEVQSHIRHGDRPAWVRPVLTALAQVGFRVPGYRVAISEFIRDRVGHRFIDEVIPAGIRPEFTEQIPQDGAVRPRGEPLTVGFLPVPGRNKGLDIALRAFADLAATSSFRFVAYDADYPVDHLPDFIEPFSASPGDAGIAAFYRSCDVFVLPSLVEGFGLPPLEAMACGAAVVVSDCGGPREYARHDHNARVTRSGSASSILAALVALRDNEDLRRQLIRNGYETAARFPERAFVNRCAEAISRLLS